MNILNNLLIAGILICTFSADLSHAQRIDLKDRGKKTQQLTMVVGEQHLRSVKDVVSFSESTRGIIEVKVPRDGRKMILTAIRPGATSLLLIKRGGKETTLLITVFSKRPEVIFGELGELLEDLGELNLRRVGARIFIDGFASTDSALSRVEQVARVYDGQVISLVQVDAKAVRPRTNIRLDLVFVGLRRKGNYKLGISWPGSYGATATFGGALNLMTGGLTAVFQVVDQALPFLEAASRYGFMRIRKRATVMTTSGNKATYEAGGEVNVAIAGSQAAELRTVPYGARLVVTPRLSGKADVLDLEVEAEISDLSETTQDVPGRIVSRVKTLVHLRLGQSILLGGLDSESERDTKTGLPGLSRIPILGLLFGTKNHHDEREEGLIIITPTVLDNVDQDGKRRLEQALSKFEKFKGRFRKGETSLTQ
jgi:pilus assembly protein CpaC